MKMDNYLHLYLGCDTNSGKLVGIKENICYLRSQDGEIRERNLNDNSIKLILRKFSSMTPGESGELNKKGVSIGQRKGYSFTPDAIIYLLTLRIDLFNLIADGSAIDLNQSQ